MSIGDYMPNKCKRQVKCAHCGYPIRVGDWIDTISIDNHNMGHTHRIVYMHDYCTSDFLQSD